ncbi:MAG: hypothetical protein KDA73_08510 [Rhodobacteraceae bacterium]|nr:hypothetical protein [Paracoccaceae bacterium]
MTRTDLILATSILLFGAFCIGFLTHWLVNRLSHVSKSDLDELDRMAAALHHAEESRDTALGRRRKAEDELERTRSDLDAAVGALTEARQDAEELRAFISEQNMGTR